MKKLSKKNLIQALIFMAAIALVGGLLRLFTSNAITGHHAKCTYIGASKYTVKPGETFGAIVKMYNDGSTTWSPDFGVFLADPYNRWNFKNNTFVNDYPPGTTINFKNLTLTAPKTPGKYYFGAEMYIVYKGAIQIPCTPKIITVAGPPKVSLISPTNGQTVSGTVGITANASSAASIAKVNFLVNSVLLGGDTTYPYSLSWNTASGGYPDGSYSVKARAVDSLGQSTFSNTATVTVKNAKPAPKPSTSPSPSSKPSGSSSQFSSNATIQQGGGVVVDKTAPSLPDNFIASADDTTKSVQLSWDAAKDNIKVAGYKLERSLAGLQDWQVLSDKIGQTDYSDSSVSFGESYIYRLLAFDAAGNKSGFTVAHVETSEFTANAFPDTDASFTSEDQIATVSMPMGSLSEQAFCTVVNSSNVLSPDIKGYITIGGPYELNCRNKKGTTLTTFNKPLSLNAKIEPANLKGIKQVQYFGQAEDESWDKLNIISHDSASSTDTVDLGSHRIFSIMGEKKKSSLIKTLVKVIIVLAALLVLARFILRWLLRRKAEDDYEEYLQKSKGL